MSCSEKHAALEKVRKTHGDLSRHSRNWIDRLGEMKLKMRNASLYVLYTPAALNTGPLLAQVMINSHGDASPV